MPTAPGPWVITDKTVRRTKSYFIFNYRLNILVGIKMVLVVLLVLKRKLTIHYSLDPQQP